MAYEFQETLEVFIPDFEEQLSAFKESSDFNNNNSLIVEIASIHAGVTSNFNEYGADALENSLVRWTSPYPKPIIMNHDPHSEPVGRVIGAKMDKEDDGTPFVRLQAAILDPSAVQKVADGRYLTGSVGGKANEAVCSICSTDWAAPRESTRGGLPCKHQRGKVYGGKVMTMQMRDVEWKEYSFVNMPADSNSAVRSKSKEAEDSDEWVKAARFFVLDMQEANIIEYTESENRNVLEGMRKKDSLPLYMGLKGAILTAIAVNEEEEISSENGVNTHKDNTNEFDSSNSEENQMATKENTPSQEDDILAIVEGLQTEDTPAEETEETAPEKEKATDEAVENEDGSQEEKEATGDNTEEQADERPQGQEVPHAKDVDSETSKGAPRSREDDEATEDEAPAEEKAEDESKEVKTEDEAKPAEEAHEDAELKSPSDEIESHEEDELKAEIAKLTEENTRLKQALHRTLAERVVDAKIDTGIIEETERSTAVNEHVGRTASSLADSLRDLSSLTGTSKKASKTPTANDLKINEKSEVVGEEENVTTIDEEPETPEEQASPEKRLEDLLVEALGGKIKL